MIYVTGDTHGEFGKNGRFETSEFEQQNQMTKHDFVIICGDFGLWHDTKEQNERLDWLNARNFSTLWIDGNHENFDLLKKFKVEEWNGGKVQYIRPSVIHLMRGQIFTIDGCKIFAFGGARSRDIQGGVLEPDDPDFKTKKRHLDQTWYPYRINTVTWWQEEQPSEEEMEEGIRNLAVHQNQVDYIFTHECAANTKALLQVRHDPVEYISLYFQKIKETVQFKKWYFGHYHADREINEQEILLYDDIIRIV